MDYEGDSEEEEDTEQASAETEVTEPKKHVDPAAVAPSVSPAASPSASPAASPVASPADGEDYDVESPNKRAKLT